MTDSLKKSKNMIKANVVSVKIISVRGKLSQSPLVSTCKYKPILQ